MKRFFLFLLLLSAHAFGDWQIYVAATGTFRGPFDNSPPLRSGETAVSITAAQFSQIDALRTSNTVPNAVYVWNASAGTATLAPISQLSSQLSAIFLSLSAAEQDLFSPQFQAAVKHLKANDPQGVYAIIYLSGSGMTTGIAAARQNMLTAISTLFPSVAAPQ